MRKPLPTLAACAVILAACSAGGTDTMAELMRDAGEMLEDAGQMMMGASEKIDAAGPADAHASSDLDAKDDSATRTDAAELDSAARADGSSGGDGSTDGSTTPGAPPQKLEASCDQTMTISNATQRFHLFPGITAERLRSAWLCDRTGQVYPGPDCPDGATCSNPMPAPKCITVGVQESHLGLLVDCTHFGYEKIKLYVDPA